MTLTQVEPGRNYIVHAITGEDEVRIHLQDLGFVPGTKLNVISNNHGNLIVSVKGSRVAVDSKLTQYVLV